MSGFELLGSNLTIKKDTEAVLTYGFDWTDWLVGLDTLLTTVYTVQARVNDPDPIAISSSGIIGKTTFVKLSNGQINKSYVINCMITTADGLIDRRNFTVKVENRSA